MGRNIPSVTFRLDRKIEQWSKFMKLLNSREREAFEGLLRLARNRRTAIGEADEPDLGVAILLAMAVHHEDELCSIRKRIEEKG